jgi:hypothetical protein
MKKDLYYIVAGQKLCYSKKKKIDRAPGDRSLGAAVLSEGNGARSDRPSAQGKEAGTTP